MNRLLLGGCCVIALLLVYLVCPWRLGIVCGASMEPTFRSGQPILIDRTYYRRHPVSRGDVVLLRHNGQTLIKRVFAVSGDAFHVMIFPDDQGINRYVMRPDEVTLLRRAYRNCAGPRFTRMRVPPGCVYVLGDNSSASVDSRDFGMIPIRQIIGRVPDPGAGTPAAYAAALIPPASPVHAHLNAGANEAGPVWATVAARSAAHEAAHAARRAPF